MRNFFLITSVGTSLVILILALLYGPAMLWLFFVNGPFIVIGIYDLVQTENAILRDFPLIGHMRYILSRFAPMIHQYFVEDDTHGSPFTRNQRELVYLRADNKQATHPFGTELDLYNEAYEWLPHSMYPKKKLTTHPRVKIGSDKCSKPYEAALLNISAMSYGALSANAILALSEGAKLGRFYHNSGEGSISQFHEMGGADLVWQLGTGYFGCRTDDGNFNEEKFRKKVVSKQVKMVEIKISQGAKPGHGGVLPAAKNTQEIATIRGVLPHTEVLSPPYHRAYEGPEGLVHFIERLRTLSEGKPIGFKLCVGQKAEFEALCEAMKKLHNYPDFITVDGAEGGTGAAPLEFTNNVGMRGEDALIYVDECLRRHGLRDKIKLIYSGKVMTGFAIFRALALGADLCNSARGMLLSLGCIQSLKCNTNACPTGICTQDKHLQRGCVVHEKKNKVAAFQRNTIEAFLELLAAAGLEDPQAITSEYLMKTKPIEACY